MIKHLQKIIFILIILPLHGCAWFGTLKDGLHEMEGKNIRTAFNVFGYPDNKQVYGDETVYYWSNSPGGHTFGVVNSFSGNNSVGFVSGPTINYRCQIKIITDTRDIIKSWSYDGNYGGCSRYIDLADDYLDSK